MSQSLTNLKSVAQAQEVTSKSHMPNVTSTKPPILADKPLPSPPIAQDVRSPIDPPRGLIDASDKPLRRSPSGDPAQQEEWPVLFPEKPTTPVTLNRMIQNNIVSQSKHERTNIDLAQIHTHRPLRTATSDQSIHRKPTHSNSKINRSNLASPTSVVGKSGSAVTEPGAMKAKDINFIQPRQTRTSTLRARKSGSDNIARGGTSQQLKADTLSGSKDKARDFNEALKGGSQEPAPYKLPRGRRVHTNAGSVASVGRHAGALQSVGSHESLRTPRTSLNTLKALEMKSHGSSAQVLLPKGHPKTSINAEIEPCDTFEKIHVAPEASIKSRSAEIMMEKRLSMRSPDHGPTLKIYRSAEKVIMGEAHKANNGQKPKNDNSIDLRRVVASKELRKARATSNSTPLESPSSIDPDSSEQCVKEDKEATDKDSVVSINNHHHRSDESDKTLNLSDALETPEVDDPFTDTKIESGASTTTPSTETVQLDSDGALTVSTRDGQSLNASNQGPLDASIPEPIISTPMQLDQSLSSHSRSFPPRGSSQATVPDFTTSPTSIERRFSDEFPIRHNKLTGSPTKVGTRFSDEFAVRQNKLGKARGLNTTEYTSDSQKHVSTGRLSSQSQVSVSKGGVLSNFRGLFHHKRMLNSTARGPLAKGKAKVKVANNGSPFPPISEVHPCHRPTPNSSISSRHHDTRGTPNFNIPEQMTIPSSPSFRSPGPSGIARATEMAIRMCDSARAQPTLPMTETYIQVSAMMVKAVSQARDAQKCFEEARQAFRKAEVASLLCEKHVSDMVDSVQEWKANLQLKN